MNNTDKTTQELREAIRDSLTRCAVNGLHLQRLNKEFILHETDQLLSLIAKHDAELLQRVDKEVIGDPCSTCQNNEQDNPNNWCEGYAKWVEQKSKLSALTEKESKE